MSDPALGILTEAQYLVSDTRSSVRREYMDGFVYAQAGASLAHSRIASYTGIKTIRLSDVIADLKKSAKEFQTVLRSAGGESLVDLMDSGESSTWSKIKEPPPLGEGS